MEEPCEPYPWSLTKAIQQLGEEAYDVGLGRVNKPDGLLIEYVFIKVSMEEGVGHIELSNRPLASCNKG